MNGFYCLCFEQTSKNMSMVNKIYPVLQKDLDLEKQDAFRDHSVIKHNATSNILNDDSNIVVDQLQHEDGSKSEDPNQDVVANKRSSNILKDFFQKWKSTDDNKEKEKLRNQINDTFILNTGEAITVENIKTILDTGDFFVARRIWSKSDGKCHDHFVLVKKRCCINHCNHLLFF